MLNELQAHHLFRSFMKSDLISQAELATGERITVDNAPTFLAMWATALADGKSETVIDALAEAEVSPVEPVAPPAALPPAGTIPYDPARCNGRPEPKRWPNWNDKARECYMERQVSASTFRKSCSIPEASAKLGVSPWTLYGLADPNRAGNRADHPAFMRCGQKLGVDTTKLDALGKVVGA